MISRGVIVLKSRIEKSVDRDLEVFNVDTIKISKTKKYKELPKVNPDKDVLYEYKVRVPLIHGASGDASAVPDSDLPYATFCPMPGSQTTELSVGDIVYVAIVDFRFDDLVILGCVPSQQKVSTSGASLQRVQSLQMVDDAPVMLGDNVQIGTGQNAVTSENFKALRGFSDPLISHVWGLQNGGLGVNLANGDAQAKKKARDSIGAYSTVIIGQSKFNQLKKYDKNTIYYIWDDQT